MLQETKVYEERLKALIRSMRPLNEVMALNAKGSEGGLVIHWNLIEILSEH